MDRKGRERSRPSAQRRGKSQPFRVSSSYPSVPCNTGSLALRQLPNRFTFERTWQNRIVVALDKLEDPTIRERGCLELRKICDDLEDSEIEPFVKRFMDPQHPLQHQLAIRDALLFLPYLCQRHKGFIVARTQMGGNSALLKRLLSFASQFLHTRAMFSVVAKVVVDMWEVLGAPSLFPNFTRLFLDGLTAIGSRCTEKQGRFHVLQHLMSFILENPFNCSPPQEDFDSFLVTIADLLKNVDYHRMGLLVICAQLVAHVHLRSSAVRLIHICLGHLSGSSQIPNYASEETQRFAKEPPTLTKELAHACCTLIGHLAKYFPDDVRGFRVQAETVLSRDNLDLFRLTSFNEPLRKAIQYATDEWAELRPALPDSLHSSARRPHKAFRSFGQDILPQLDQELHESFSPSRHDSPKNAGSERPTYPDNQEPRTDAYESYYDADACDAWDQAHNTTAYVGENIADGYIFAGNEDEYLKECGPHASEVAYFANDDGYGEEYFHESVEQHVQKSYNDVGAQTSGIPSLSQWVQTEGEENEKNLDAQKRQRIGSRARRPSPHIQIETEEEEERDDEELCSPKVTRYGEPPPVIPLVSSSKRQNDPSSGEYSDVNALPAPLRTSSPSKAPNELDAPLLRIVSRKAKPIRATSPSKLSREAANTTVKDELPKGQRAIPYLDAAKRFLDDGRLDLALECVFRLGTEDTLLYVLADVNAKEARRLCPEEAGYLAQLLVQIVLRESTRRLDSKTRERTISLALHWMESMIQSISAVRDMIQVPETHWRWSKALFMLSGHSQVGPMASRLYYLSEDARAI